MKPYERRNPNSAWRSNSQAILVRERFILRFQARLSRLWRSAVGAGLPRMSNASTDLSLQHSERVHSPNSRIVRRIVQLEAFGMDLAAPTELIRCDAEAFTQPLGWFAMSDKCSGMENAALGE